ncbi:MAG: hypothetical protein EPO64_06380 [Nitrospirae bacterium]|nr:MAG: hypothetical protein EPO64_06380 [Nitrospirota bacterium]
MRNTQLAFLACLVTATFLPGCASSTVIPAAFQQQLDRTLTFRQLKESPDSYQGRLVVLGGEVLSAKRLKAGTRIEILQLPLDNSHEPGTDLTASEGRFLAMQEEFLDPATLPEGTRVTIVGEVTGVTTLPLDEVEYVYPTLEIKHLKVWTGPTAAGPSYLSAMGPYWSPYWMPFSGPYWGGPFSYWNAPYWCAGSCLSWRQSRSVTPYKSFRSRRRR